MHEIPQAFTTIIQTDAGEMYHEFISPLFQVNGIDTLCHITLGYVQLGKLQYDESTRDNSQFAADIELKSHNDTLGQIGYLFRFTGPSEITIEPDVEIVGENQGLGIGRQLMMLTDQVVAHARANFRAFDGYDILVKITDQAGERTREDGTHNRRGKLPKRMGWTSYVVENYLEGFIETTQPGEYPRTFVKKY